MEKANEIAAAKLCSKCGKVLPMTEFYNDKTAPDGKFTYCKDCTKSRLKKSAEKRKATKRKVLSIADFTDEELFAEIKCRNYTGEMTYTRRVVIEQETIKELKYV